MQRQPILIDGYWTWNGKRFNDMLPDEQLRFIGNFTDLLHEHGCNTYLIEYWTRNGDDKDNHRIKIIASSPEQAEYLLRQQSKFIIRIEIIEINGQEYKNSFNN